MLWPLGLIVGEVLLILLGNALGRTGGGTEASLLGCLPGIPGILCVIGGVLWLLVDLIISVISWIF